MNLHVPTSRAIVLGVLGLLLGLATATAAHAQQRGYELVSPADDRPYAVGQAWRASEPVPFGTDAAQRTSPDGRHAVFQIGIGGTLPGMTPDGESLDYLVASRGAAAWDWRAPLEERTGVGCGFGDGSRFDTIADDGATLLIGLNCAADKERIGGSADQVPSGDYSLYGVDVLANQAAFFGATHDGTPRTRPDSDEFLGGSPDLSTVYFQTEGLGNEIVSDPYVPTPQGGVVYKRTDGVTEAITKLPSGEVFGLNRNATLGSLGLPAVSSDGAAVTFTTQGAANNDPPGQFNAPMVAEDTNEVNDVYQVRDGDVTWISDPNAVPATDRPATGQTAANRSFEGASADGTKVFFSTTEQLTAGDADTAADLYVYDFGEPANARIAHVSRQDGGVCAVCGDDGSAAHYVTVSGDGNRLFFVTADILAADDADAGSSLYVRDLAAGTTSYVAPANASADSNPGTIGSLTYSNRSNPVPDSSRPISVSDDGAVAAFSLQTNYTLPLGDGGPDGDGARDLFIWRAGEGVRRVRQGLAADANTTTVPGLGCYFVVSPRLARKASCRPLTADATAVFFETTDALVSEDTDGGQFDVYSVATDDGSISLVSSPGDAPLPSRYVDSSASGDSVFFITKETLDPSRDTDAGREDLYVARTGAVFPPLPPPPPGCVGDGCQGPGPTAPGAPPVRSQGTVPADNVAPRERIRRSLRVKRPTRRGVRRLARTGRMPLRVRLTGGGTIRVGARARVRVRVGGRIRTRSRRVARTRKRVGERARSARVVVRLNRKAKRQLRRNGKLGVRVRVRVSGLGTRTLRVVPRRPQKRARGNARRSSTHDNRQRG